MAQPIAPHPLVGCHYVLGVDGHTFHACDPFWMQPITVVELPEPIPPIDLAAEAERRRRELSERGIKSARRQNRAGGAR